jgi:hypothetical protein
MYCPTCDEALPQGLAVCPNCTGPLVRHKGMVPAEDLDYDTAFDDRQRSKKLFLYGLGGLFFGIILVASGSSNAGSIFGVFALLGGYVTIVVAACYYAKSKGQPAPAGLLVIFGVIGIIVLFVLPDKYKT